MNAEIAEALAAIRDAAERALRMGDSINRVRTLEVIRECAADVLKRSRAGRRG